MDLIRLAPSALRDFCSSGRLRFATFEDDFPHDLLAENRRSLIAGPWLYFRGRVQNRRGDRRNW